MRTFRTMLVALLMFTLALTPSAFAQERHAVSPSALAGAVAAQVAQQDSQRAAIHEALNRPEVRAVAAKSGLDLDRRTASIDAKSATPSEMMRSASVP